ncbi:MAG: hypothetical protein A49_14550 [Methyloceanibacter sp.]|nr:MAG: hypothetical protein A49_14550 [Methyloceanibacter sp.]
MQRATQRSGDVAGRDEFEVLHASIIYQVVMGSGDGQEMPVFLGESDERIAI